MRARARWTHVTIALALIAALAMAAPAIGGPSLKKLVKKEVAKQIGKATGPPGPPGAAGADGVNGTARAYARVVSHLMDSCSDGNGQCTFDHAKGVTSVIKLGLDGWYCVHTPGISPNEVPAAVSVDLESTAMPTGNASVSVAPNDTACGADSFLVVTDRQPSVDVDQGGGSLNAEVAGNAVESNGVGFTIVIP
jgi:hypothetical protein